MTTPSETDGLTWDDLDEHDLDRLKLSPEVAWYLEDRGFAVPDCPPLIKTLSRVRCREPGSTRTAWIGR